MVWTWGPSLDHVQELADAHEKAGLAINIFVRLRQHYENQLETRQEGDLIGFQQLLVRSALAARAAIYALRASRAKACTNAFLLYFYLLICRIQATWKGWGESTEDAARIT